jgi:hypothetical protein
MHMHSFYIKVFATAALAYPAARISEGYEWTDKQLKYCLATNIVLQIVASLSGNLFATWFGPVAIVGPIFFAAQLLANLVVFWIVLGLESFSREMQIGTYVIVAAVILLIVNGPGSQDYGDTTFQELISQPYAMVWGWILFLSMMVSGVIVIVDDLHKRRESFRLVVLLVARGSAFSLNLSTGKAVVLPSDQFWLIVNIIIKVVSGIIYTRAIVVQSTAVKQNVFVPMNATLIVFLNAATGIIIWEDWRVVQSWIGYVCVFFLLALGCGLLLGDLGLLQETAPETFLGARASMFIKEERTKLLDNLKGFGQERSVRNGLVSGAASMDASCNYVHPNCDLDNRPDNLDNKTSQDPPEETNPLPPSNSMEHETVDFRPIPMRLRSKRRTSRLSIQRNPRTMRAWASVYGRAKAAPRLSVVPSADGYTQIRWSNIMENLDEDASLCDSPAISEVSYSVPSEEEEEKKEKEVPTNQSAPSEENTPEVSSPSNSVPREEEEEVTPIQSAPSEEDTPPDEENPQRPTVMSMTGLGSQ